MRHIRIMLEDEEANLLDIIRKEEKCTYRDLLMISVTSKKNRETRQIKNPGKIHIPSPSER